MASCMTGMSMGNRMKMAQAMGAMGQMDMSKMGGGAANMLAQNHRVRPA